MVTFLYLKGSGFARLFIAYMFSDKDGMTFLDMKSIFCIGIKRETLR